MGKAFTDEENKRIIAKLLIEGRRLALEHGFSKASVDELVKRCGISKGQFYRYYESKEAFFWAVREQVESEIQGTILKNFSASEAVTRDFIIDDLCELFRLIRQPQYRVFFDFDELCGLTGRLSHNAVSADFDRDIKIVKGLISQVAHGMQLADCDYELITGIIRSAFLVASSENKIGENIIDSVCRYQAECLVDFVGRKINEAAKR